MYPPAWQREDDQRQAEGCADQGAGQALAPLVQYAPDMGKVAHHHDRAHQRPAAVLEGERLDDGKCHDQCQTDPEYVEEAAMAMIDERVAQASEQHGSASLSAWGRLSSRLRVGGGRRRHTLSEIVGQGISG